jgi:hypothetical protein
VPVSTRARKKSAGVEAPSTGRPPAELGRAAAGPRHQPDRVGDDPVGRDEAVAPPSPSWFAAWRRRGGAPGGPVRGGDRGGARYRRGVVPRPRHPAFPDGFFDRSDETNDGEFYRPARLVTHIDARAVAAVGALYAELGLGPDVLDVGASWVSHFPTPPAGLTLVGMNAAELDANPQATASVVRDLNADPTLPFADGCFDDAVCCVSVDYLTRPVEVFAEVGRVLRPGGRFVCSWSNRCFPTKVVRGWLAVPEDRRHDIVTAYFTLAGGWTTPVTRTCLPPDGRGDPLWAVWARRA